MRFKRFNPDFDVWIIQVLKCWLGFPQKQKKQSVHRRRSAVRKKKDVILRKKTEAKDVEGVESEQTILFIFIRTSIRFVKKWKPAIYQTHFPADSIRLAEKCSML